MWTQQQNLDENCSNENCSTSAMLYNILIRQLVPGLTWFLAVDTFDASKLLKEFHYLQQNDIDIQTQVTDTFDKSEFLRQFDSLQSHNVDILALALVLSSIPSNLNKNDLL